jgi:probable H4MPT-linked C1 transfer pathway protein
MKKWLALDIGGANVKVADGGGYAMSHAFSLWKHPQKLSQELRTCIAEAPPADHLAITMTGELADCFDSKLAGVKHILQSVAEASDGRHTRIYLSDGRWVAPMAALKKPALAASSNWRALARFAGRCAEAGPALVIDVGSTTCDVVPLLDGECVAAGHTDIERLISGELIYTGVERSPVCGVVQTAPYRDKICRVAQELFATTLDVYLILAELTEDPSHPRTADGRPATKAAARTRLARMLGADADEFNHRDAVALATAVADAQAQLIADAAKEVIARQSAPPKVVVISGQGEFVARAVLEKLALEASVVSLAKELGQSVSTCAPAHALAVLTRETLG